MVIDSATLEDIYQLNDDMDVQFFRHVFNRFLIMSGISPDVPIGMHAGMMKVRGIWQPGIKYTQYSKWEERITEDFGPIRKSGFGRIRKFSN